MRSGKWQSQRKVLVSFHFFVVFVGRIVVVAFGDAAATKLGWGSFVAQDFFISRSAGEQAHAMIGLDAHP